MRHDVSYRRCQPADEIEDEKSKVAHAVFNVISEDPEKESVPEKVAPATMQKHRYEGSQDVYGIVVDHTRHAAPKWHRGPDGCHVRQLARNQPEIADAGGESLLIEARALDEDPGQEHRNQDEIRHPRRADRGELVAERDQIGLPRLEVRLHPQHCVGIATKLHEIKEKTNAPRWQFRYMRASCDGSASPNVAKLRRYGREMRPHACF